MTADEVTVWPPGEGMTGGGRNAARILRFENVTAEEAAWKPGDDVTVMADSVIFVTV